MNFFRFAFNENVSCGCSLNHSLFFFFCTENQERTNIELGEVKGIFYLNPIEILCRRAEEGSPQMAWQPHSFLYLSHCSCTCSFLLEIRDVNE